MDNLRATAWMTLVEVIMGLAVLHYLREQAMRLIFHTLYLFRW